MFAVNNQPASADLRQAIESLQILAAKAGVADDSFNQHFKKAVHSLRLVAGQRIIIMEHTHPDGDEKTLVAFNPQIPALLTSNISVAVSVVDNRSSQGMSMPTYQSPFLPPLYRPPIPVS